MGVLTRDFTIHLLNCSPTGCLLETSAPLDVGTIGSITLTIDGEELHDHVRIVRCQPLAGAGERYHVGVQFLWVGALTRHTLRGGLGRTLERLAASVPVAAASGV
jgi:hypothetical protein